MRQSFIYPHIKQETRVFGSANQVGSVINESGNWMPYLPIEEHQKVNGVESSACYIEAQQHTISTILEKKFSMIDSDFASRFNALLSDGKEFGGDPLLGAESIRKDGLIRQELMPFNATINSWSEFHSWKGANEEMCRKEGKDFLKNWKLNYDIVFERELPLDLKYKRLRDKLKTSPVPMSVYGETDVEGNYISKPNGVYDTHMVEAVYVDDDNCIYIWDTYAPFLKKLPANYNPDFAMMWGITKIEAKKGWWDIAIKLVKWFYKELNILKYFYGNK